MGNSGLDLQIEIGRQFASRLFSCLVRCAGNVSGTGVFGLGQQRRFGRGFFELHAEEFGHEGLERHLIDGNRFVSH
ncbi:MAG TPA: hypothetical protein VNN06_14325, partial [Ramlibacter sp.]|nr:hypothetical protein [Ramlibacter sp.]